MQLSDEITWEVEDRETGAARARITMKAGDVAAMPADIRHQGSRPSARCCWCGRTPRPTFPSSTPAARCRRHPCSSRPDEGEGDDVRRDRRRGRRQFLRVAGGSAAALALHGIGPGRAAAQRGTRTLKIGFVCPRRGRWRASASRRLFLDGIRETVATGCRFVGRAYRSRSSCRTASATRTAPPRSPRLILSDKIDLMLVSTRPRPPTRSPTSARRLQPCVSTSARGSRGSSAAAATPTRASSGRTMSSGASRTSSPCSSICGTS